MVESYRRLQIHDFLLAVLSTVILVYFCWPNSDPHQRVQIQNGEGKTRDFVVTVGSNNWKRLAEAREQWLNSGIADQEVVNQWRLEVAGHYLSEAHERALGRQPVDEPRNVIVPKLAAQSRFKANRLAMIESSIQRWEENRRRLQTQREKIAGVKKQRQAATEIDGAASAPIVFSGVYQSGKGRGAFAVAFASGIAVGLLFTAASWRWPLVQLVRQDSRLSESVNGEESSSSSSGLPRSPFDLPSPLTKPETEMRGISEIEEANRSIELADFSLDLPERWISVKQSPAVLFRQVVLGGLILSAVLCVLL